MPVREGYIYANDAHEKTKQEAGWTYGCHSSKVGDKPRGGTGTYMIIGGYLIGREYESEDGLAHVAVSPAFREHTTHWLDTQPDGTPLKCGHEARARLTDPQCIGCANRE